MGYKISRGMNLFGLQNYLVPPNCHLHPACVKPSMFHGQCVLCWYDVHVYTAVALITDNTHSCSNGLLASYIDTYGNILIITELFSHNK